MSMLFSLLITFDQQKHQLSAGGGSGLQQNDFFEHRTKQVYTAKKAFKQSAGGGAGVSLDRFFLHRTREEYIITTHPSFKHERPKTRLQSSTY